MLQSPEPPMNKAWTIELETPWAGDYYLVWNPRQAEISARRWKGEIPKWVLKEITQGTLVHAFANHPQFSFTGLGRKVKPPEDFQMWPRAGVYQIKGDGKGL